MDEPTSRVWCRPELIVLVRSGPEEMVLTACKMGVDGTQQSSIRYNQACRSQYPSCVVCAEWIAS
jgi:hypothetical protein